MSEVPLYVSVCRATVDDAELPKGRFFLPQGYFAPKKQPPSQGFYRALGIVLGP